MTSEDNGRIDPAVVAALYSRYADELRAFLVGMLRNRELAAEVLQTTFSRALEKGHTARDDQIKGWLFRIAYHEAMLLRRKAKTQQTVLRQAPWKRGKGAAQEKPDDALVRREDAEAVRQALSRLPAPQRDVVIRRIHEQKTFAAIAEELGLPLGTVLTRMRLALRDLQKLLTQREES